MYSPNLDGLIFGKIIFFREIKQVLAQSSSRLGDKS
jgi:hypothetical protein